MHYFYNSSGLEIRDQQGLPSESCGGKKRRILSSVQTNVANGLDFRGAYSSSCGGKCGRELSQCCHGSVNSRFLGVMLI